MSWCLSWRSWCSAVRIYSLPFVVQYGVPQGSVLRSLLLTIFKIIYMTWIIARTVVLLLTILKSIKQLVHLVVVCFYDQILIVCMNGVRQILWNLISVKLKSPLLPWRRTVWIISTYMEIPLYCELITWKMQIDCKLHIHRHLDFHFLHVLKLLGLIRAIFYFSTSDSLSVDVIFCFCQIWTWICFCCLEPCYDYWSQKFEFIQRNFAALCHNRFFQVTEYYYDNSLEWLNL
jgi:hypothetical protein